MKRVMLMIILIFLVNLSYAQEINLNYPETVDFGIEFDLTLFLSNFDEGNYDVKIEILNGSQNLAQRFWDGEWKSTYYWMYNSINISEADEKKFKLKINYDFNGSADLKIKIKGNGVDEVFEGNKINIISPEEDDENEENNSTEEQEKEISLGFDWNEEDIINGEEFDIELEANNLKGGKYDIRIWIAFKDNDTIISDRYSEEEDEWKSGSYYINNLFEGSGDETEEVSLRIREEFESFEGSARLYFKIRNEKEISETIEILKKDPEESEGEILEETKENSKTFEESKVEDIEEETLTSITGNVIRLGKTNSEETGQEKTVIEKTKDIKIMDNALYESETEKIKKYSVFGFALLCLGLSILIIMKKLD